MPLDHFDLIARHYDRFANFTPSRAMLDSFSLNADDFLLDAGGGTGRVADGLKDHVRRTVVMDLSCGMLRQAAAKGLEVFCAPVEHLPIPSGTFDRIIMVDAFHHVVDQILTALELWRVLAPGGRIVIIEPDIQRFLVKLIALGEKILFMRSHFLSAGKIADIFRNLGAQVSVIIDDHNVIVTAQRVRKM